MRKLVSFSYYVERLSNKRTYPKFLRGQKMKNGLLVGNAPLSLVNLYAQVTKKRPIFYCYKSIGLAYLIYMVDHGKIIILLVFMKISS